MQFIGLRPINCKCKIQNAKCKIYEAFCFAKAYLLVNFCSQKPEKSLSLKETLILQKSR